jgi:hypothetical protein
MAFVSNHVELQLDLADSSGLTVKRTYEYVAGTTVDDATTGLAAVLATVNALTDDVIVAYRLTEVFVEDTIVLPAAGVQSENQLIITAKIDGDPLESGTLTMPAPVIGAFVSATGPGSNIGDTSDALITNFTGLFADGGQFTFSDGELLNPVGMKAKRRHVKNNNG